VREPNAVVRRSGAPHTVRMYRPYVQYVKHFKTKMPFEDVDIRSPELVSIEYHVAESTLLGFSVFQFYTVQIFIHMTY
jgi:hypothetical protein